VLKPPWLTCIGLHLPVKARLLTQELDRGGNATLRHDETFMPAETGLSTEHH
jgi:hypothetical protein